ncbi:MAG: RHS repeat-associated core domain-containing protein [Anaerolineales bacterium]|nr:RHS repeat-associated core domain-containing protein [Anaerolineales bacterium]
MYGLRVGADDYITYARTYDPYGVITAASRTSQTDYGFTGEAQDSYTNLVYLRARFYNPVDGRFQSRDTWGGDVNSPMSFNRWNYASANPILYTDPSGFKQTGGICNPNATEAAKTVNANLKISRSYWLDTYVAAGIAVQCWAATFQDLFQDSEDDTIGQGPAQTTNIELQTGWGKAIKNEKGEKYAYGKLCYIVYKAIGDTNIFSCSTVCEGFDQLVKDYGAENVTEEQVIDQTTWTGAATSMRRRISQVLDKCLYCTDTDRFIAAALAQDVQLNMTEMKDASTKGIPASYRYPQEKLGMNINWKKYFDNEITAGRLHSYGQVARFDDAVTELKKLGWAVIPYGPDGLVRAGIDSLRR